MNRRQRWWWIRMTMTTTKFWNMVIMIDKILEYDDYDRQNIGIWWLWSNPLTSRCFLKGFFSCLSCRRQDELVCSVWRSCQRKLPRWTHSSIHPSIHPYIHSYIYPFILPSIHTSIHIFIYSSVHPSIHPFIYLSIHRSVYPFNPSNHGQHVHFVHLLIHPSTQ